ncbi:DUF2971 domain-containing protein [Rhizobium sp. GR12]|uniref:DUF2971 domain-containing protein n=1 Tax=Rhizobium sp. GR12 TaxID=3053925 RepID=UPI002FBE9C8B
MYHYTAESGFKGILQSHELWLSDLQASNDPRDIQMGLDTLRRVTDEIGRKEYSSNNARVLAQMTMKMIEYFKDARCYTTCFTPNGDNINMWREYGGNGDGYAIGFRSRAITDMHGRIYRVRYVDESSEEHLYNLISEVVKPIEIYGESIFRDAEKEVEIGTALISIVNSLKHFSWEYEGEIRLTYSSGNKPPPNNIPISVSLNGREKPWTPYKTRNSGNSEIKYHSLPFGKFIDDRNDHREAIKEVVIGPKSALSEGDIRNLLSENGFFGVEIRKSACAFR